MGKAATASKPRRARAFKPKRGRPNAQQAEAITQSILDAAGEVFLTQGFEGAAMEAVAAKAHVPKSTLYKRYPDKTALVRAVLEARVAGWSKLAERSNWMLSDDLEQRLKLYATGMLAAAAMPEIRAFTRLAAHAWPAPEDIAKRHAVLGRAPMLELIARDISEFGPSQGVRAKHPRRVAEALMAMLEGWLEGEGANAGKTKAMAFAQAAVEMLLHGKKAW